MQKPKQPSEHHLKLESEVHPPDFEAEEPVNATETRDPRQPGSSSASLLVDAKSAAELIGVSPSTFWKLHSQGRIPNPMRLGGRVVRWRREELSAWVRAGCPARHLWRPDDRTKSRS